ncbi:MAG: 23S rRNA (adenine(2503)-C(2))-methyltransferase RlmN [Clostridia bacterium]|nr:23S rRNA (adenine(2503)-C(2))-methyltransferase RlmN [Clostridia bacterium]
MEHIMNLDFNQLKESLLNSGEKAFRAGQIFKSLHMGLDFDNMTDISKELRQKLNEKYISQSIKILQSIKAQDGTEKFLFSLKDGNLIEGVLMRYKYGNTICISTQVGCRMGCAFCASGLEGLVRNLEPAEMLGEIVSVNAYLGGGLKDKRQITNVVLMGSGEPLDNYDNVIKFLRLVSDEHGINISPRNVSLSTAGLVPQMYKLADEGLPVNLTVSLHSPIDEERKKIMPIANAYSIAEIIKACDNYFEKTGRRFIFEYVLIKGNNDTPKHAQTLIDLLSKKPCHVNLIRLNEVKENQLKSVADKDAYRFLGLLERGGVSATVRRRMGDDIEGACGQLRRRYLKDYNKKEI